MAENPERGTAVRDGTELTVDVLRWDAGWEFDCPVCVLRPVVRFSPNGEEADQIAESLAEDAAITGLVEGEEPDEDGLIDRQYRLATLKRRWGEAWRGKDFPNRGYTAARFRVRFTRNAEGDLGYTLTEVFNVC